MNEDSVTVDVNSTSTYGQATVREIPYQYPLHQQSDVSYTYVTTTTSTNSDYNMH